MSGWTDREIDLIVSDYFTMLGHEISGNAYSKVEHRRGLLKLIERSEGSVEFKHQNISAVMMCLGQPWIDGYKPASNFQNALVDGVLRWLNTRTDWLSTEYNTGAESRLRDRRSLWIGPPPEQRNEPLQVDNEFIGQMARKYNVAERDALNHALGAAGEETVLAYEKQTLIKAGRNDLANKVRWTAVQDGDGYGYDIASFEPDGRDRLIEVKTTNGWERTPFHITQNELHVAQERHKDWHLLRLWNFARKPKAFALRPPLDSHATLTATSFMAHLH